ncbi:MAG TPA: hypothetical protein VHW96_22760 [Solirubrobacteraceae bacterium]|nr:hypothetical protein [Solirubrobacteraceae bacterium]
MCGLLLRFGSSATVGATHRPDVADHDDAGDTGQGAPYRGEPPDARGNLDFHRAIVAPARSPRLTRAHEPLVAESQILLNLGMVPLAEDVL